LRTSPRCVCRTVDDRCAGCCTRRDCGAACWLLQSTFAAASATPAAPARFLLLLRIDSRSSCRNPSWICRRLVLSLRLLLLLRSPLLRHLRRLAALSLLLLLSVLGRTLAWLGTSPLSLAAFALLRPLLCPGRPLSLLRYAVPDDAELRLSGVEAAIWATFPAFGVRTRAGCTGDTFGQGHRLVVNCSVISYDRDQIRD